MLDFIEKVVYSLYLEYVGLWFNSQTVKWIYSCNILVEGEVHFIFLFSGHVSNNLSIDLETLPYISVLLLPKIIFHAFHGCYDIIHTRNATGVHVSDRLIVVFKCLK